MQTNQLPNNKQKDFEKANWAPDPTADTSAIMTGIQKSGSGLGAPHGDRPHDRNK